MYLQLFYLVSMYVIVHDVKLNNVFPVWALMWILGAVVAVVVFLTSKHEKKPVYHWVRY